MTDIAQAMTFVEGFSRSGKPVRDLSRIRELMHRLGDPQDALRFIHIAGTNGKGSVAEYLTNIFTEAGYRTGTFTSPYILHYQDRIRLNRQDIPEEALCRHCAQVRSCVTGDEGYSQFEITFAVAMLYFRQERAEVVILETGIGGLLDCTNMIAPPLCSVVTAVSYDHMTILGSTIGEIASQKAGILKAGSPAVFAADSLPEALCVLREKAGALGIPYTVADPYERPCRILGTDGLYGNCFTWNNREYRTRMGGIHQLYNAVTALRAAEAAGETLPVTEEAMQRGLAVTQVPGRIQILRTDPLTVLDGSHNAAGLSALADVIGESGIQGWTGICGMTHGDAVQAAGERLSPYLTQVFCTDGFIPNAVPAGELCKAFSCPAETASPEEALNRAAASGTAVVIFGSLYLASRYLKEG